jgi:hydrogenase expression/formation protein HypD
VHPDGNRAAQELIARIFTVQPQRWRGIGEIGASGLGLAPAYARFDAMARFPHASVSTESQNECISGEILRGRKKPGECAAFGTRCTPERPLGATMVSSEGACAAYYRYRRQRTANADPVTP